MGAQGELVPLRLAPTMPSSSTILRSRLLVVRFLSPTICVISVSSSVTLCRSRCASEMTGVREPTKLLPLAWRTSTRLTSPMVTSGAAGSMRTPAGTPFCCDSKAVAISSGFGVVAPEAALGEAIGIVGPDEGSREAAALLAAAVEADVTILAAIGASVLPLTMLPLLAIPLVTAMA